jgi:ribosomal protein S18 acetylase RimI-like enzyme
VVNVYTIGQDLMGAKMQARISTRIVNYLEHSDRDLLISLLDMYARDAMGGGEPLTEDVKARLCDDLAKHPCAVSFFAFTGDGQAVGLLNAMLGYSTFKAKPLLNVHDIAVDPAYRGQGIGQALLQAAQTHASLQGCCKLTLEVLSGNARALRAYEHFGFKHYALLPEHGQALFMQKWL